MIDVKNILKHYGKIKAIDGVSFTVRPGEIVGLLGPNGAGKTSLMRVLTGYHYPSGGEARICDIDVVEDPLQVKQRIGYLPESTPLYNDLTVFEYLDFISGARGISGKKKLEAIHHVKELCSLDTVIYRPIDELSKGFRQRVGLAQALIHDPDVIILDEPTSGLDPNQIREIRDVVKKLGSSKTVILSTHIMQEVEILCDRVLIMNEGVIVAAGSPDEIAQNIQANTIYHVITKGRLPKNLEKSTQAIAPIIGVEIVEQQKSISTIRFICNTDTNIAEDIFDWAVEKKLKLLRLERERVNLETTFTHLTQGEQI